MKISVFCKPYLREQAERKLANGSFAKLVLEHVKKHGEFPVNEYNLRYHGDGTVVTIASAQ